MKSAVPIATITNKNKTFVSAIPCKYSMKALRGGFSETTPESGAPFCLCLDIESLLLRAGSTADSLAEALGKSLDPKRVFHTNVRRTLAYSTPFFRSEKLDCPMSGVRLIQEIGDDTTL